MEDMDLKLQREQLVEKLKIAQEQGDRGMVAYYRIQIKLIEQEIICEEQGAHSGLLLQRN
ncbi:hypothetical protein [Marinomonas piezotolerans]|uniref:hypothetical protein n=1 Tax=Marinomonas piezotolerans TaxID=2213058 RepID=UPI0013148F16|nr:hypothetical protein [Marinomonas piezotolerans]